MDGVCILITIFLFLMSITVENKSQKGKNEKLLFLHNVESTMKQHTNSFKYCSTSHSTEQQQGTMLYFIYTIVYKKLRKKNTRSICPQAILSFSNILYYSLFTFHFKGRKSLYILLVTRNDGYQESCSAIYMSSK